MEILYGRNAVLETLRASRRKIITVFVDDANRDHELARTLQSLSAPVRQANGKELTSLTGSPSHQGLVAKVDSYPYTSFDDVIGTHFKTPSAPALIVVCDSIQDPQNLGTLCRSAFCFGVTAVILPKDRSADITPVVVRASAGTTEHLSISRVINIARTLEELKKNGFWIYGADSRETGDLAKIRFDSKAVIVFGNEGEGIRPLVLSKCDFRFRIRTDRPFDSLNVAQSASIVLYEVSRQRQKG